MKHIRCECPFNSVGLMPEDMYAPEELNARVHKAHKCPGTNDLALYRRGDRTLWLCSCCCMPGDVRLEPVVS